MLECEITPLRQSTHQDHIKRRRSIAINAVQDRPINLRIRRNEVPRIKPKEIIEVAPAIIIEPPQEPKPIFTGEILSTKANRVPPNFIHKIMGTVGASYGKSIHDILSHRCFPDLVRPRHIAMYLCRELLPPSYSTSHIGMVFKRDHTSARSGIIRCRAFMAKEPETAERINAIRGVLERDLLRWRCTCG